MAKQERPAKPTTCLDCGVCCISPYHQSGFADLCSKDLVRLPKQWVRRHVLFPSAFDQLAAALDSAHAPALIKTKVSVLKSGPLKGYEICRCVALTGVPMKAVWCSIYTNRPEVCHEAVRMGDRTCMEARRQFRDAVEG